MNIKKSDWLSLIGVLLCSQAVIHLELLLIRTTSVILWHHHTPLVISLALFGFGISGVFLAWLTKLRDKVSNRVKNIGSFILSLLFAAAIPLAFAIFTRIPLLSAIQNGAASAFFYWFIVLIFLSLPFFLGGSLIGLWLVFSPEKAGMYYGFNLIGSAMGSLSYLITISSFGASGSIFFISCILFVGALFFSLISNYRWISVLSSLLVVAGIFIFLFADTLIPVRAPAGKRAFDVSPDNIIYSGWNAISRIDVMGPAYSDSSLLTVLIDGGSATTYIPQIQDSLQQEDPDRVRSGNPLIHRIRKQAKVLVIGSGGGVDVRDFLVNGAQHVTAVEANPLMNTLVEEEFGDISGNLYQNPHVLVVSKDGRNFLSQTKEQFDIIHLGLPITNAALASGALNLMEDSLLTQEAFASYFDHLTPDGILYVLHDEISALRCVATAERVFKEKGKTILSQSLVVLMHSYSARVDMPITQGRVELFFKNSLFTQDELNLVLTYAERYNFVPRYIPNQRGDTYFHRFLSGHMKPEAARFFPLILRPTTDDRPFFNHLVPFGTLFHTGLKHGIERPLFWNRLVTAETSLVVTFVILLILVISFVVPGLLLLRQSQKWGNGYSYLAAAFFIGLGFILTELVLLSWIRMLWGYPETAAICVLAGLLGSAGVGSLSVKPLSRKFSRFIHVVITAIVFLLVIGSFSLSRFIPALLSGNEGLKIAVVIFLLGGTGFLLGMPFTWVLQGLSKRAQPFVGWAWAINIFASTLGAALGFIIAMDYGYSNVLLTAGICYGISILFLLSRRRITGATGINL